MNQTENAKVKNDQNYKKLQNDKANGKEMPKMSQMENAHKKMTKLLSK